VLVFNGEIYNHPDLQHGPTASPSDTEALAVLLARRGTRLLPALDGPFALARYDPATRRLLLARDRLGKKPLYYARMAGGWAFASTLQGLHVAAGPLRIRPDAISEYLVFRSVGGHQSAFAGVEQVRPGTWIELDADGIVAQSAYWRPPVLGGGSGSPARVRALIDRAVAARADESREVGVFLSGGLDSAVVAASLHRQRPDQAVRLLSAGYDVTGAEDERPFALRIGAEIGARHDQVIVGERAVPELMAHAARLLEEPVQDPVTVPTLALARAAAAFTRVVLTGDGTDELWGGYARFDAAPATLADYWPRAAIFRPDELGLAAWPASYLDGIDIPMQQDPLDRILRVEIANRLRNYHLSRIDKLIMGTGVEPRCPHLDPAVLEAALRLPARVKRSGSRPKGLLIDAYRADLPAWLLERRKQPFSVPVRRWLAGGLGEFARDLLLQANAFTRGLVDARPLFAQLAHPPDVADPAAARVWSLLHLEVWHQEVAVPLACRPAVELSA
jgi:asparagine synthase (glutamine-hydrolysing)